MITQRDMLLTVVVCLQVMMDVDNGNHLHWMVVNIPGEKFSEGDTIAEYNSPTPGKGEGPHRYVFLAMEQGRGQVEPSVLSERVSRSCSPANRSGLNVRALQSRLGLSEPVAANYLTVEHEDFVDSIKEYCKDQQQQQGISK